MAESTAGQTRLHKFAEGVAHMANGSITFDATAITAADYVEVNVGFTPKFLEWSNDTSRIKLEWRDGMAANSAIKVAAVGTRTLEVTGGNGGITVIDKGFRVSQNATLAAILASQVCRWNAHG